MIFNVMHVQVLALSQPQTTRRAHSHRSIKVTQLVMVDKPEKRRLYITERDKQTLLHLCEVIFDN